MSILIDEINNKYREDIQTEINGEWYRAKPLGPSLTMKRLLSRIIDAYRILTNESIAVHFKEDELKG